MIQVICFVFILNGCSAIWYDTVNTTLQQVHVVFRHGDRTPDDDFYPKDPHINDTWYPEGLGQLTLKGKGQEYNIGKALRDTYYDFLGNIYTPDIMDAWSTDINRTKMSLELVLAGLWPPALIQTWNFFLPWQPVPYNYLNGQSDLILRSEFLCPSYQAELVRVEQKEQFRGWLIKHAALINYINVNSGLRINSFSQLTMLYFLLYAEQQTGRDLPKWTKKVFPKFLEKSTILFYIIQTYNDLLNRLSGGPLVKIIIENAREKINGTLEPKNRKLFLYSGHEYNVVHLLAALNVYEPHIPPYSSYVVVELHKINDQYGFKILYQDYESDTPQLLEMPGCEAFCPFYKFVELTKNIVPRNITEECSVNYRSEENNI